eukprot:TRINITY_DN31507_c0_g1_i2.p1 TRINITY_DN31507_c0_g1~~TRINITY_DN31507_c0_g1_i2.p1  ORF type:complete len:318 (+),score=40.86 TRINITY_DN31507_c0_g1_i2:841-1794(+)
MSILASALYKDHVLLLPSVRVDNPMHSRYPRDYCTPLFANASEQLRQKAPPAAHSCLPDPLPPSVLKLPTGGVTVGSYLPWGKAKRKLPASTNSSKVVDPVSYRGASLDKIEACEEEASVKAMSQMTAATWCIGCSPGEILLLLQIMTSARPRYAPNWNQLGVVMTLIGQNMAAYGATWHQEHRQYYFGSVSFIIAQRIIEVQSDPPSREVDVNVEEAAATLEKVGVLPPKPADFFSSPAAGERLQRIICMLLELPMEGEYRHREAFTVEAADSLVQYLMGGEPLAIGGAADERSLVGMGKHAMHLALSIYFRRRET